MFHEKAGLQPPQCNDLALQPQKLKGENRPIRASIRSKRAGPKKNIPQWTDDAKLDLPWSHYQIELRKIHEVFQSRLSTIAFAALQG